MNIRHHKPIPLAIRREMCHHSYTKDLPEDKNSVDLYDKYNLQCQSSIGDKKNTIRFNTQQVQSNFQVVEDTSSTRVEQGMSKDVHLRLFCRLDQQYEA